MCLQIKIILQYFLYYNNTLTHYRPYAKLSFSLISSSFHGLFNAVWEAQLKTTWLKKKQKQRSKSFVFVFLIRICVIHRIFCLWFTKTKKQYIHIKTKRLSFFKEIIYDKLFHKVWVQCILNGFSPSKLNRS